MTTARLPAGIRVLERGWLSANNILLIDEEYGTPAVLVDTGYVSHAEQTVSLVAHALGGRPLGRIVNTHLHSDHCGGNAALQAAHRCLIAIPPGEAEAVRAWDAARLSYEATGQRCARFDYDELLQPGSTHRWAGRSWQVHAAPGHDPHAVMLLEPESGTLVSGDALWENGFGVVFPEIEGEAALDDVEASLDVIERLRPRLIIPGHGSAFTDITGALTRARRRLAQFRHDPLAHGWYASKVLVKFHLLEVRREGLGDLCAWMDQTPYLHLIHQRYFPRHAWARWQEELLEALFRAGALLRDGQDVLDAG
ncbi:MAG TPA: MBL fold metallo-hydrolase [Burkholderiaceae bacterium]|nr:MBL fold metallo-hydrolase [Burkholderiaceae bacterium]